MRAIAADRRLEAIAGKPDAVVEGSRGIVRFTPPQPAVCIAAVGEIIPSSAEQALFRYGRPENLQSVRLLPDGELRLIRGARGWRDATRVWGYLVTTPDTDPAVHVGQHNDRDAHWQGRIYAALYFRTLTETQALRACHWLAARYRLGNLEMPHTHTHT